MHLTPRASQSCEYREREGQVIRIRSRIESGLLALGPGHSTDVERLERRRSFDWRSHSELSSSWRGEEISAGGQLPHFRVDEKLKVPSSWTLQNSSPVSSNPGRFQLMDFWNLEFGTCCYLFPGWFSRHVQVLFATVFPVQVLRVSPMGVKWPRRAGAGRRPSLSQWRLVRGVTAELRRKGF